MLKCVKKELSQNGGAVVIISHKWSSSCYHQLKCDK